MIAHHLTEPRTPDRSPQPTPRRPYTPPRPTPPALSGRRRRIITDIDIADWQQRLASQPHPLPQLRAEQQAIWRDATIRELELGLDRGRITIPIRDRLGKLQGVLRYAPRRSSSPKMLAIAATRLGLIPHPATERSRWIVLVEGPPDMIAARSRAIPAIAVPGDHAWDPAWAPLLAGRHVAIITDADAPGRDAAQRIASDLTPHAATVRTIDPAPDRDDGYDLTDWLHAHPTAAGSDALRHLARTHPPWRSRTRGRRTGSTDPATAVTPPPAQPRAPATLAAATAISTGSEPLSHSHRGLVP